MISLTENAIEQRRVRVAVDARSRAGRQGAADAGERVGFAEWVVVSGDEWELEGLFVDPAYMRRGIGGRLVQDVIALAREAGVRRVGLIAEPRAAAFYERHGFVREGAVATRFGPALRMAVAL